MRVPRTFAVVVLIALGASGCMRSLPPARVIQGEPPAPYASQTSPSYLAPVAQPIAPPPVAAIAPPLPAPVAVGPSPVAQPYPDLIPVAAIDDRYRLDAGDRLRVVVFGQEGLTNTYAIDAGGAITMPLIGSVQARGMTTAELSRAIATKLRNGFIREPSVAVEVETYRPFFILGEVAAPGQYPYVPNMTAESAVAIAGGYSPRAIRNSVKLTRSNVAGSVSAVVPPTTMVTPGDTILVGERWF